MGIEEVELIKKKFSLLNLEVEYLEHEEVITSEDAAKTRGFELKQGIKAILFTNNENDWVVVDVPADKRVDQKKVAVEMEWSKSKIRMATEEEVMKITGCKIGAVPPFGHKENFDPKFSKESLNEPNSKGLDQKINSNLPKNEIKILVDLGIYDNEMNGFNIGLRTMSVRAKTSHMKTLFDSIGCVEGEFAK